MVLLEPFADWPLTLSGLAVVIGLVLSTVLRITVAALADPDKSGRAVGPNADGAARNAAARNAIENIRDMKFLPNIGD